MKQGVIFFILTVCLVSMSTVAQAAIKIEESLKQNYTYLNEAPVLKPTAMSFLMLEAPNPSQGIQSLPSLEDKAPDQKPGCFGTNRTMVRCMH